MPPRLLSASNTGHPVTRIVAITPVTMIMVMPVVSLTTLTELGVDQRTRDLSFLSRNILGFETRENVTIASSTTCESVQEHSSARESSSSATGPDKYTVNRLTSRRFLGWKNFVVLTAAGFRFFFVAGFCSFFTRDGMAPTVTESHLTSNQ